MKWLVLFLAVSVTLNNANCLNWYDKLSELVGYLVVAFSTSREWNEDYRKFDDREIPNTKIRNYDSYDFVIVGAGTAGSTLAARLAEVPNVTVLLIEAGDNENLFMDVPVSSLGVHFVNKMNYRYSTENTGEYCRGMTGGRCLWPRGRVTGGNSVFNFMIASRGHQEDYDDWAMETGDLSWGYESMLEYFKKLENFNVQDVPYDNGYHNYNGPVPISQADYKSPFAESFVEAGKEVFDLPRVDYNGVQQTGFSLTQSAMQNNERWSTNRAYLQPAKNRGNLFITRNARVTKILIRNDTTAYGVTFVKNDKEYDIYARKEVIITAGAIETPKLLMLSGIGPKKHLQETGIRCIKNAPGVGENLLDHPAYAGLIFLVRKGTGFITDQVLGWKNLFYPSDNIRNYVVNRQGPLTNPIFNAVGFVNSNNVSSLDERPDLELLMSSGTLVQDAYTRRIFGISEEYFNKYYAKNLKHDAFMIWPVLLKPKSRGKVLLRSVDAQDKPILFANYFQDRSDVEALIRGIRMAVEVGKSSAMRNHETRLYEEPVPGCENLPYDSDAYWECALRTFSVSGNHQAGSCKMGLRQDPMTVVDYKLRVIGIDNLRIGDASVMPSIPAGDTNLPTIAIAEKLSDIVKSDHGYTTKIQL